MPVNVAKISSVEITELPSIVKSFTGIFSSTTIFTETVPSGLVVGIAFIFSVKYPVS